MKCILGIFLIVGALAQPKITPSLINTTYDLAADSTVRLPVISLTNLEANIVSYNANEVTNHQPSNVLIWPVHGVIPPGTNQIVRITITALSRLTVGEYHIPIAFNLSTSVDPAILDINLNVIDSRTYMPEHNPIIFGIISDEWDAIINKNQSPVFRRKYGD